MTHKQTDNPRGIIRSIVGERNQPGGFPGINDEGAIEADVSIRYGTVAELSDPTPIVPADGQLIAFRDDDGNPIGLNIGDGTTPLGSPLTGMQVIPLQASGGFALPSSTTYEDATAMLCHISANQILEITLLLNMVSGGGLEGFKARFEHVSNVGWYGPSEFVEAFGFAGGLPSGWEYEWEPGGSLESPTLVSRHITVYAVAGSGVVANTELQLQLAKSASLGGIVVFYNQTNTMLVRRIR